MKRVELRERLLDLIVCETLFGLNDEERVEMEELKMAFPEWRSDESLQLTLGAMQLASLDSKEALPAHLEKRILRNFETEFQTGSSSSSKAVSDGGSFFEFLSSKWLGWAVAGCLAFALAINTISDNSVRDAVPSLAEQRQRLMSTSGDAVVVSWSNADDRRPVTLSGDIVWSNSEQRGYMRLSGLPANDRNRECYQLWIFDTNQSDKTPVDGGVFNVEADGEVIIPVDAKLKVIHPTLFAITVEKPGGVVVSGREQIAAIAKVGI